MSQTINAGLDIGYGQVKCHAYKSEPFVFPAHTALVADTGMLTPEARARLITLDGQSYLVGEDARQVRDVRETHIDSDRIRSVDFKLLGMYALRRLGGHRINVTMGLPVRDYTRHRPTLESVVDEWNSNDTKVHLHRVVPQPLGTFVDLATRLSSDEVRWFEQGKVAIIDIGYGTTDLIEINENQFNPNSHATDSFAVSTAMKLIRNQLLIRHNAEFEITEIPKIVEQGEFTSKGKPVQIGRIISDAKRHVVVNTVAVARRLWGNLHTFRYIIVTGGGAEFLRSELSQHIPAEQLLIPDRPEYSNVSGFMKLTVNTNEH